MRKRAVVDGGRPYFYLYCVFFQIFFMASTAYVDFARGMVVGPPSGRAGVKEIGLAVL